MRSSFCSEPRPGTSPARCSRWMPGRRHRRTMNASPIEVAEDDATGAVASRPRSPARAWLRALELTTPIARNPGRILPVAIEEAGAPFADAPALLSGGECFTYRVLAERANCYARWALDV